MDGINVSMHPETVAVLADLKKTVEKSSTTRATRAIRHKAEHQSLRQSISAPNPLALTDGNRRKSSRAKPSDTERERTSHNSKKVSQSTMMEQWILQLRTRQNSPWTARFYPNGQCSRSIWMPSSRTLRDKTRKLFSRTSN